MDKLNIPSIILIAAEMTEWGEKQRSVLFHRTDGAAPDYSFVSPHCIAISLMPLIAPSFILFYLEHFRPAL